MNGNTTSRPGGEAPHRGRVRSGLKRAARGAGVATSGLRPLPDFLIIGAKRGGTTSLYHDLVQHPSIVRLFPPPLPGLKSDATKGVHYFDSNYPRGEAWYRSYFPTSVTRRAVAARHGGRAIAGEASPYYLFHPAAAARAHETLGEVKVIALLRDPVQRTYSHWKERRRGQHEPLDFLDALDAEPQRLAGERERLLADPSYLSYAWEQQSYATQSRYSRCLRPWFELFGPERMFVAASEEYYSDPVGLLGDIDDFLGLPRRTSSTGTVRNAASGSALDPDLEARLRAGFRDADRELRALLTRPVPWLHTDASAAAEG